MKFDHITLRNFKPYADADLSLSDGVTVIHGLNGSGKSSLLEACFFALYGSKALEGTLDDVVTNGEEETLVELTFTHEGAEYRIERRLRAYDERVDHQSTLEGDDGVTRDGARAVREFVTELLRMDVDAFLNCAYVRQGEVNKLINATSTQRQAIIDDLLQLGKLEEYRERAGEARLGVEDVRNAKRAVLEDVEQRIERKEERNLHARLNELESDLADVDGRIGNYEEQREKAVQSRNRATEVLDDYETKRTELESLESEIDELGSQVRSAESDREALGAEIREARERIDDLEAAVDERLADAELDAATEAAIAERRAELDERERDRREARNEANADATGLRNQARNLAEKADDLAERAEATAEEADRLDADADAAAADIEAHEESLAELEAEAEDLRGAFANAPADRGEAAAKREELREKRGDRRQRVAELEADLENARERVAEAEELLAAGKCPECGQPVEDSPHTDRLTDDRERVAELESELESVRERVGSLEERIADLEKLVDADERLAEIANAREMFEERIAEKREAVTETREAAAEKRAEADDLRDRAAETRSVAETKRAEAEEVEERVEELEADLEAIAGARARVDAIEDRIETVTDIEDRIDRLRERRDALGETNDQRRERLAEKRERREDLRDAVDEEAVAEARERRTDAEEYLEKVDAELGRLAERRDELQSKIGGVKGEIEALEELRAERDGLARTVAALDSLHEETRDLEAMYGDLRAELRQRNVRSLERMLNETFDLVYGNDAYSYIELDGEYELTVYQKDGQPLEPEQLSGGERALFNLSLRCAIYRLLAEGIEGTAPTPPLILDEPTVFLDAGHVSRLVDLVEEMRGFGVRQIVIVSHDEELVGAADDLVTVEKNPRSNRSTVMHTDANVASAVLSESGD